jgi:integrase
MGGHQRADRDLTVEEARVPSLLGVGQARRMLDDAEALPNNLRALQRGLAYGTIFALCHGLGLRAGVACGLRLGDVDQGRQLLIVRG